MNSACNNVVFVVSCELSRPSAAVVCVTEMCNAFTNNGVNLTLCAPLGAISFSELSEYYGISHSFEILNVRIPALFNAWRLPGRSVLFSLIAFSKLGKKFGVTFYTRDPWIAFLMSAFYRRQVIFESHQFRFSNQLQTAVYRGIIRWGVRTGNMQLVCISKNLKRQWSTYGIAIEDMHVAHDAVNIRRYTKLPEQEEARRLLGIDAERTVIVYTGSLLPGKGVDVLINCARRLPVMSFVIVGGERGEVERFKSHLCPDNIIFVGRISPLEVPLYQAAADILALPNTKGSAIDDVTSPLKLFEYMASERPIVATDIPSVLEILEDNRTALISSSGDVSGLSKNILRIAENPSLGRMLAKNARQEVERFTWDARVAYIMTIIATTDRNRSHA